VVALHVPVSAPVVAVPAPVINGLVHVNVSSAQLLAQLLPLQQAQVLPTFIFPALL
jgi:hypothetical protein